LQQLEMITDLLGTPAPEDMKMACDAAKRHVLSRGRKSAQVNRLFAIGEGCNRESVHLLLRMLTLNPDQRTNVEDALKHPYLDEGRLRYHSCMCSCCSTDIHTDVRR